MAQRGDGHEPVSSGGKIQSMKNTRLMAFAAGVMLLVACGERRPDEATRKQLFQELRAAEQRAERIAFEFIQNAEDPHDVDNVEKYREIRRDSAIVAWDRIMEASGWDRTWADSVWTEGMEKGWAKGQ